LVEKKIKDDLQEEDLKAEAEEVKAIGIEVSEDANSEVHPMKRNRI